MIIPHNYNAMLHSQLFPPGSENENRMTHRIQKYERALEHSHPITIGPKHTTPKCMDEARKLRIQVRKLIESGHEMSVLQARRCFGLYLEHILKRLSSEPKTQHEELILKFLYRVGCHMRQPFFIRNFGSKALGKDRGAMVAKQLGDYLHLYSKETEAYVDSFDMVGMIPMKVFNEFLLQAGEADLESVLTLHTNLTQQMPFLYNNCSSNVPSTPPIPVGPYAFLKALPTMAPGGVNKELHRIDNFYRTMDAKGKKSDKNVRLSPIKKASAIRASKEKDGVRPGWLY